MKITTTKIFFIGDTHFGKSYPFLKDYELNISKRNLDVIENCENITNLAIEEKADYVIFLGDLYDRQVISPTIRKIVREKIFVPLFENNIPTIILGGNHDSVRNPKRGADIQELSNFPNVDVITEFKTKIIESNGIKTGLMILPFIHFDVLVDMAKKRGMEIEQEDHNYIIAQRIIKNYVAQVSDLKLKDCDRKILIGHYFLEGAKIRETNNPTAIYGEFLFNREMVQKKLFDLVIYGHVHLRQTMWNDDRIVILGSIDRIDMGERDSDKYYCLYDVEKDSLEFREIECRNLFRFNIEIPDDTRNFTEYIIENLTGKEQIKDALCKIKIEFPKGQEVKIDKIKLKNYFSNSFHTDIQYVEKSGKELENLRVLNLDPVSLFEKFIEQNYPDYKFYTQLKTIGVDLLKKEFSSIDVTASGPLSIESVELENFNNYGKGPNKVIFDQDSYVIKGPTGSGKSSILDAVTFALFKRSTRRDAGLTLEEILYKNGKVVLEFLIGDKLFQIKRSTRSPKLEIKLDGEHLYQGLKIPEKEKKIQEIVGYDYDGFISSFFIRQQELQIFSNLTSGERQERLAKLFKLKIFQDVNSKVKDILKDLDRKKDIAEGEIKAFLQFIEELPEFEKEILNLNTELKKIKADKKKLDGDIQNTKKSLKDLIPSYEEYEKILALSGQVKETIINTKKELKESKAKQTAFNQLQEKLKNFENLKKERDKLEIQKEQIEEKIQEKEKIESEVGKNKELMNNIEKQYDKRLQGVFDQITDLANRIKEVKAEITKDKAFDILRDYGRLSERVSRLQKVEIPMATEYKDEKRIKEFESLETNTRKELKAHAPKQRLVTKDVFISDELIIEKKKLEKQYNSVDKEKREEVKEYNENIKKLNNLLIEKELIKDYTKYLTQIKKEFDKLKQKEEQKETIENKLKQTKDYSTLIKKLETDLTKFDKKLETRKAKLKELKPAYEKYAKNFYLLEELREKLKEIEQNIAVKTTELKNVKENVEKIKKTKEKIKDNEKKLNKLKKDIEIYSMLRKNIFHLNGVPKFAIEQILPAISIRAGQILGDLTDGRLNTIKFRPLEGVRVGFDIFIYDGTQDRGASSYSGGEKTQINAAIRFAIMERIAEIPDTTGAVFRKSNTLFIDEGDLGTLDDDVSRQRFVEKILELKSMFKKIILITHLEDVAEQFPNRIKIGWDESGKSKIY